MGKILRSSTFNRIRHIIKRHYEDLGICRIVILTNTESGAFVPGPLPHFNLCIFPILNPTLETTKLEDNHHSQSCRTVSSSVRKIGPDIPSRFLVLFFGRDAPVIVLRTKDEDCVPRSSTNCRDQALRCLYFPWIDFGVRQF